MSALPKPDSTPQPRQDTTLLIDGLLDQVSADEVLLVFAKRVERAIEHGADDIRFSWQTPDDRETAFQVYYRRIDDDVTLVTATLEEIDHREPTDPERAHYNDLFDQTVSEFGDLWMRITGHIQRHSQ